MIAVASVDSKIIARERGVLEFHVWLRRYYLIPAVQWCKVCNSRWPFLNPSVQQISAVLRLLLVQELPLAAIGNRKCKLDLGDWNEFLDVEVQVR
jgi:hypothetical protein